MTAAAPAPPPLKTLATATVENRLMHHAHVCQTAGDSIRLTQAIAGKGVVPWASRVGTSGGHHRADPMATSGHLS